MWSHVVILASAAVCYEAGVRSLALPEVLLFDLDDTLIHFSVDQPDYWRLALEAHLPGELAQSDLAERAGAIARVNAAFWADDARAFWGRLNMWEARRIVARQALAADPVELAERIADSMTRSKEAGVRPFDGAVATLRQLVGQGHRLGLLTNGSSRFQREKLRRCALGSFFELILIEGELGFGKPDARVFERALEFFGRAPGDVCMIGDNLSADIAGAQRVGLRAVWHDGGRRGLPSGLGVIPDATIHRVAELAQLGAGKLASDVIAERALAPA